MTKQVKRMRNEVRKTEEMKAEIGVDVLGGLIDASNKLSTATLELPFIALMHGVQYHDYVSAVF